MILTITMNPSVDISYPLDVFKLDTVNRTNQSQKTAGGKGLNVTRVLQQFNEPVIATGLVGGVLGDFIKNELNIKKITHDFFNINEETRNCIAILSNQQQTEILEAGPTISPFEAEQFLEHVNLLLERCSLIAISGSLPAGLPKNYYCKLLKICSNKKIPVVLDTSGTTLKTTLEAKVKPVLIKPNTEELSELLEQKIGNDPDAIIAAIKKPLFEGIEWVVVSRGSKGAIAKHWEKIYLVDIPKVTTINPVGSGDSMIAGLLSGLENHLSDELLLKRGCVLGILNAQEPTTGTINMDHYDQIYDQIKVSTIGGNTNANCY